MDLFKFDYYHTIKYILIGLRIILTLSVIINMSVNQKDVFDKFNENIDQKDQEYLKNASSLLVFVAIIMHIMFALIFSAIVLRQCFGGILVMTTLCFLSFSLTPSIRTWMAQPGSYSNLFWPCSSLFLDMHVQL